MKALGSKNILHTRKRRFKKTLRTIKKLFCSACAQHTGYTDHVILLSPSPLCCRHAPPGIFPVRLFPSGTITLLVPSALRDVEDRITKASHLTITGSLGRDAEARGIHSRATFCVSVYSCLRSTPQPLQRTYGLIPKATDYDVQQKEQVRLKAQAVQSIQHQGIIRWWQWMQVRKGNTSCTMNTGKKYTVVPVCLVSEKIPAWHSVWGLV